LPSFESAGERIPFHVSRSFSVSWRPADAGGVHLDTGALLVAPKGMLALGFATVAAVGVAAGVAAGVTAGCCALAGTAGDRTVASANA
jgi:hypothetical protein